MTQKYPVILFDGECILCNRFFQYVLKHDRSQIFHFASLQSNFAQKIITSDHREWPDSVVLLNAQGPQFRSTAALKILISLGGWRKLGLILLFIPAFIRDWCYNWIAKRRYAWFGRRAECLILQEKDHSRFLS